jgi:hypothetical protein
MHRKASAFLSAKKTAKLNAVSVIEYADGSIIGVHSFSDDEEGNKEAEECFKAIVRENCGDMADDELDERVEDGFFDDNFNYQAFITHSS